ncbi:AAA family ATPase [Skermanella mucosa]|uniref:ATP-binding protein n=1 Tax=Skermanella mucosa TaxID=1789672 RepID=UPI00192CDE9E|nr:YhaN family protein [Skermanella mucosa]UEM18707.1 AAA family ATPase [Skermanella mucosa]
MRLIRLGLDRFGHFTDGGIDLGARPDFHIVCGNNEAGKTTTLRALSDLFFGIETRSPYNFKHDYADLRLTAEIEAADGRRLAFQRRKGRQNTLLDADGSGSLPDTALAAFLGPIDRDFFEGMFGLDHNRLRRGGEDILAARGDVGQSLFGAGAGVMGISQVLAELDAEANALFSSRRVASKPFYQALDRHADARKRLREAAVSGDEWRQVQADAEAAEARIRDCRERLNHLESARAKAERIRRTRHLVSQIAELEDCLGALADALVLAEDAADRRQAALRQRDEASRDVERCGAVAAKLAEELDGLTVPEAVLASGPGIEALHEQRGAIRDQRADLPKRESELRQLRDQAADLLRRLGSSLPVERAAEAIPPKSVLADVRALIAEEGRLRARSDAAADQLAKSRVEAARLEAQLEAIGTPADAAVLNAAIAEVKARGTLEQTLAEGQARLGRLKERIAAQVASLPLWQGSLDGLLQAKVPDDSTVTRFEKEFADLEARSTRAREKAEELRTQLSQLDAELAALKGTSEIPTAEAIAEARRRRDTGWRVVRRTFIDRDPPPLSTDEAELFDSTHDLPGLFEQTIRAADDLVDRKEAEAHRVANYVQFTSRHQDTIRRLTSAAHEVSACDRARGELEAAWAAAWRPAGLIPVSPREMSAWLARVAALVRDADSARDLETSTRRMEQDLAGAHAQLVAALSAHGSLASSQTALGILLRQADGLAQRLTEAALQRQGCLDRLVEQRVKVVEAERQADACAQALGTWQGSWGKLVERLGRDPSATPAGIEETLGALGELGRRLDAIKELTHRVERIGENVGRFEAEAVRLATALGLEAGGDAIDLAGILLSRLQQARGDLERRQDLATRLENARSEVASAEQTMRDAEAALERLRAEAGSTDDGALDEAIQRSNQRRDAERRLADLRRQLLAAGDGLGAAQLMAEAAECDPDRLAGDLQRISAEIADLQTQGTELGGEQQRLRQWLGEMERGRGGGTAAQEAQEALADLRDTAENYARVRTAALLLRRAVDRYRQEQQGPLLRRAAELFGTLTLGNYTGLKVEFDDRDQAILKGERRTGVLVDVSGMSDGTRDQLFLALRVAAIELYVAGAEPIPFVADDLLVNYDDDRAAAALSVLHDLSRQTQVLFFTHHSHLCDVAKRRLGAGALKVHALDQVVPA